MTTLPATLDATAASVLGTIDTADLADSTKKKYRRALRGYLEETGAGLTDRQALRDYARQQSESTQRFLSAAVTRWADSMIDRANSMATPDNTNDIEALERRLSALKNVVKPQTSKGQKTHTWLSQAEVKRLMRLPADDVYGKRDRVALGLMVAGGLRRAEAVAVTFADIKLQPVKGKMRTVVDVRGKGAKDRTVPLSDKLANLIDVWGGVIGHERRVVRSLGRNRIPGDSLSTVGLFNIVSKYGKQMGKDTLAPHDLRRTYAQIGYESGVPITQISTLLGHANVATTQRYLNLDLDLEVTVSDFVPL